MAGEFCCDCDFDSGCDCGCVFEFEFELELRLEYELEFKAEFKDRDEETEDDTDEFLYWPSECVYEFKMGFENLVFKEDFNGSSVPGVGIGMFCAVDLLL